MSGRTHQRTDDGLHRKPIVFMFGADYRALFEQANKRAAAVREWQARTGSNFPAGPGRTPACGLAKAAFKGSKTDRA